MSKLLLCACALVVAFASPASAQIQKVQGVAGGYPVPVSISGGSFPVPTGGATSANQTNGTQKAQITDGTNSAAVTNSAPGGSAYGVVVRQAGSAAVTGPLTDAELRATAVPVSAASLPLPSGAATSALQTAANLSLSSIDATVSLVNAALAKLTITQGTALGTNTVAMSGCSVLAAAPTYASGGIQPCSLDTSGRLRTLPTGTLTPADSTANPSTLVGVQAFLMGWNPNTSTWDRIFAEGVPSDNDNGPTSGLMSTENYAMLFDGATWDRWRASSSTSGSARMLPHDGTNGAAITAASTAAAAIDPGLVVALSPNSATPKFADTTCSGTITNGSPTLTCSSLQGVAVGGFRLAYGTTGSVSVACSYDGTNYSSAIPLSPNSGPSAQVSSVSASGEWFFQTPGCTSVRFTLTAGTGSHAITARFSGAAPSAGAVVAAQGTAAANAGAWPLKVTDGTNTATVVAGSQFAPASSPALVTHERGVSSFYYGATNATHTAKAAAGLICGLLVTAPGAGGNTLTLYNSTGAATSPVAGFDSTQVREWTFGGGRCLQMSTGITVISSGGSAPQFTVLYE